MAFSVVMIIVGAYALLPGIGAATVSYYARWPKAPKFVAAVVGTVFCIWGLSEVTGYYLVQDMGNVYLSIAAYLALCVLGTQVRDFGKKPVRRLAIFVIFTPIISGPAVLAGYLLFQPDNYPPHHIERLPGNLTCYINDWGKPMDPQGQRIILLKALPVLPFFEKKVETVIVKSSGFSEGFFTCQNAVDAYHAGETYKYIVH